MLKVLECMHGTFCHIPFRPCNEPASAKTIVKLVFGEINCIIFCYGKFVFAQSMDSYNLKYFNSSFAKKNVAKYVSNFSLTRKTPSDICTVLQ